MMTTAADATVSSVERVRMVKIATRADGVAVLTIDDPYETHNTIRPAVMEDLFAALAAAEADGNVSAIVLASGKKSSFVVGANIDFVRGIKFSADAEEASREVARRFRALAHGRKPIVAYVHGAALGGGFELSLACTASIATDDPATVLGLPEVKLGLVPAANGLFRVAERAGLRVALDLGMTGKNVRPKKALKLGLVDDVVAEPTGLEVACALASRLAREPGLVRVLEKKRVKVSGNRAARALLERNPIGRMVLFRRARQQTLDKTRGHYPAAERIIDLVARYGSRGFGAAAELEPRVFGDLVVSETAHRLIDLFFAQTSLKKDTGLETNEDASPFPVERVAVLGAGLMGAGIAAVSVQAGLTVRMKDTDDAAIGRGLKYVKGVIDERARRGSLSVPERDRAFARLSGAIDYAGFRRADLVVEAVFEDLALKHAVIRDIETIISDRCVIASNTSSIPIARIAEGSSRPEMVVGMHYFSPVHRMPLLEVVRTDKTDPRAVATAVAVGKRQGKTVIVVRDGAAFYTTRILVPYLNEAAHLLAEGCAIDAVDRAMVDFGFPVGPFQLLDEVGIDVGAHVGEVTEAAFGERMRPPEAFRALVAGGRKGRKNERGFYTYGRAGAKRPSKTSDRGTRARGELEGRSPSNTKVVDATIYDTLGIALTPGIGQRFDEIALRCSLAMVNEALRAYGDGVVRSPRDGDIGAIFGVGFPPFRGGPFRFVDVLGGVEVLRRIRALEQRFGTRFEPAPLLVEMARGGRRFYG
jgi:3-hydroxyacyl-CoA dehydrogenase / enoyl-CoA hydratase / 3-hydroxybutyryl-CoA epimerase